MRIEAVGPRIRVEVNGQPLFGVEDGGALPQGRLILLGTPMKIKAEPTPTSTTCAYGSGSLEGEVSESGPSFGL